MKKLSVVLATRNEEANIERCLRSVVGITDEIIIADEHSTDRTREIAEKLGARVILEPHHDNFHITKQKAIDAADGEWILQLDADEVVSPELAEQIANTIKGSPPEVQNKLFTRHQQLIERRDGPIGKPTGEVVGYFLPRRNIFLGKPLIHAGVYPDGVIRLFKNGKARLPQASVHEQIKLDGEVSWLSGDLLHYDSPTLKRYFSRLNRYTDLQSEHFRSENVSKNFLGFVYYTFWKPLTVFINLFLRHRGFLDGVNGFLWSFFSATHFPIAYFKYLTKKG